MNIYKATLGDNDSRNVDSIRVLAENLRDALRKAEKHCKDYYYEVESIEFLSQIDVE